ncbi:MAG: hypothetical protein KIC94_06945 [Clostridiales bacterium]|nr:hypothetical protein [Clostridiales bacterium]
MYKIWKGEMYKMDSKNQSLITGSIGEKNRDASSGIRGFVYQNLIAIEELINEKTKRIFCEYIEDVTVEDYDGNCKIIQAKYYSSIFPASMHKDVYREMYCQYLKLSSEGGFKKIIPVLNVFSPPKKKPNMLNDSLNIKDIQKPNYETGKKWVVVSENHITILSLDELETKKLNMVDRENALITWGGSDEQLEKYHKAYDVINQKMDLEEYREQIGKMLVDSLSKDIDFDNSILAHLNDENREKILIGLSYMMILKTFDRMPTTENVQDERITTLNHKQIMRDEFITQLKKLIQEKSEDSQERDIALYIEAIVTDTYFQILDGNPNLLDKQEEILLVIYENTKQWFVELVGTKEGQYQLINTTSYENEKSVKKFITSSAKNQSIMIIESISGIRVFLKYFWKIILNICMNQEAFDFNSNRDLLDPRSYVVDEEKKYICLYFQQRDFVKKSVILPSVNADEGKQKRKNFYSRMYELKPKKWFLGGDCRIRGKFDYQYSPANIRDLESISDIRDDSEFFYLECMGCIGIDDDEWHIIEDCNKCIFAQKCVKGEERWY